jgi:hypothetical protein
LLARQVSSDVPRHDQEEEMAPRLTEASFVPERETSRVIGERRLESPEADGGGLGRAFVVGSVLGFVTVMVVCGAIALVAGSSLVAAVGIGAFAGFWGGPGFGGMMGAVLHHSRTEGS